MSLDVYLNLPAVKVAVEAKIFVREDGQMKEISRAEWAERFPGREPYTVAPAEETEVYWANITHNLARMADEAGLYKPMWRPEEMGITHAQQLIEPLRAGLERLRANPEHFEQFNPDNGWGDYEGLVSFASRYLHACEEYPSAEIYVSR